MEDKYTAPTTTIELPPGTMLIKATDPKEQGPCVMINKEDFDAATMEEYAQPRVSKTAKK